MSRRCGLNTAHVSGTDDGYGQFMFRAFAHNPILLTPACENHLPTHAPANSTLRTLNEKIGGGWSGGSHGQVAGAKARKEGWKGSD